MTKRSFALMTAAFLSAVTAPVAGFAVETTAVETNAQERINFSGKLRMLSQRIPSAACHLAEGIDPDGAMTLLTGAVAEFDQIINALEFGNDPALNIMLPEERRRTLERIAELRAQWEPLKAAAEALIAGQGTDEQTAFILTNNLPVLRAAQLLVEELVKQYSNPNATTQAMLFLIDISGRQRMLTQKTSKESCMLEGEFASESTLSDMEGTIGIFEASLGALRFGMPTVGVNPPPNDEIAAGLDGVLADWQQVKPLLDTLRAGGTLTEEEDAAKFRGLNTVMANMNTVVGMYTAAAGQ